MWFVDGDSSEQCRLMGSAMRTAGMREKRAIIGTGAEECWSGGGGRLRRRALSPQLLTAVTDTLAVSQVQKLSATPVRSSPQLCLSFHSCIFSL